MDTTIGNKLIAEFMDVTYYDSYGECRDGKLRDLEGAATIEEMKERAKTVDQRHQFCPEYHNSYDRMIPVVRRLKERLKEEFGMAMYVIECMSGLDKSLCYEDKPHLFNLLCETIAQFNQLTKNKSDGKDHHQSQ